MRKVRKSTEKIQAGMFGKVKKKQPNVVAVPTRS